MVGLCGCQLGKGGHGGGTGEISKTRALQLAKERFSELYPGRLKSYRISISSDLYDNAWYVLFTGTGEFAVPGGYTPMLVDKRTGHIRVVESD
jgi:hypothetical protein